MFRLSMFSFLGIVGLVTGAYIQSSKLDTLPQWQHLELPSPAVRVLNLRGLTYVWTKDENAYLCSVSRQLSRCRLEPSIIDLAWVQDLIEEAPEIDSACASLPEPLFQNNIGPVAGCSVKHVRRRSLGEVFVIGQTGELWGAETVLLGRGHVIQALFGGAVLGVGVVIVLYSLLTPIWLLTNYVRSVLFPLDING